MPAYRRTQAPISPTRMQPAQPLGAFIGNVRAPYQFAAKRHSLMAGDGLHRTRGMVQITKTNAPQGAVTSSLRNGPTPKSRET